MDFVLSLGGFTFIGESQDLALRRMEFHLVGVSPSLEVIQVFLQDGVVLRGFYLSVEQSIISKESDDGAQGQSVANVVYVD